MFCLKNYKREELLNLFEILSEKFKVVNELQIPGMCTIYG